MRTWRAQSRWVPAKTPRPTTSTFQTMTETPDHQSTFQAEKPASPAAGVTRARIPGKKRETAMAGAP